MLCHTYIQFNSGMCHLTPPSCLHALASLLSELLFTRGGECTSPEDLLDLYQQHFGVPLILEHFGVKDILSLVELRLIKEVVKLAHVQVSVILIVKKYIQSTSKWLHITKINNNYNASKCLSFELEIEQLLAEKTLVCQ